MVGFILVAVFLSGYAVGTLQRAYNDQWLEDEDALLEEDAVYGQR